MSRSRNPVGFAPVLAVFHPAGCETVFFGGCNYKTEILQLP
jgi:hypothetical protein